MKRRFLVFAVSLTLFGAAFGCIFSSDSDDYMKAYQHTAESDLLIVETALGEKLLDEEKLISAKAVLADDPKTIVDEDVKCALVDNETRARCVVSLDKGELPRIKLIINATVRVPTAHPCAVDPDADGCDEYNGSGIVWVFENREITSPVLNAALAKRFVISLTKIDKVEVDGGYFKYHFALSGSSVDPAAGIALQQGIDIDGARHIVAPLAECDADSGCTFSFDNYSIPLALRWVRVIDGEGRAVTPFLSMKGCVQTEDVAGDDGASVCLPYVAEAGEANSGDEPISDSEHDTVSEDDQGSGDGDEGGDDSGDVDNDNSAGDDFVDSDGDGIADENDECIDEAEVYDLSTLGPADGLLDGCPNSSTVPDLPDSESDVDIDTGYAGLGADTGGACSLSGSAAANPATFLLLGLAFMPLAIRRKKK